MEDLNTTHANTPKLSTLNQLLDQVELLATAYEKQRTEMLVLNSEMETARNDIAEARSRALRAEQALSEQTATMETRDQPDQMSLPMNAKKCLIQTHNIHPIYPTIKPSKPLTERSSKSF
jgi:predicted  nucleic acid-binding Zn-ribbon protein